MKKLHREVVVMPEREHKVLRKVVRKLKIPKSRVFRRGLLLFALSDGVIDSASAIEINKTSS